MGKKRRVKKCDTCQSFIKWTNDQLGGALCDFFDARTTSSSGRGCKYWKAIPYDRRKIKYEDRILRNT
jgi:hypothetical protein